MANLVKFIACSAAAFQAATKDASTLYFVEDEQRLYKGEVPYSGGIYQVVASFPETGALNTIYKNSQTGEVAFWNGTAYQTLVKPMGEVAADNAGLVTGGQVFAAVNAVQGEVDTLEGLVGTLPADANVTNVVAYVDKKTAGIASDAALTELAGRVTTAEGEIDAIQADYLKAADKTALQNAIDAEASRADAAEKANAAAIKVVADDYLKAADKTELSGLISAEATTARAAEKANADAIKAIADDYLVKADKTALEGKITAEAERAAGVEAGIIERVEEVEAFFHLAEGEQLNDALDTLVEIQAYLNTEGAAADQMVLDIAANAKAIADEIARATKAEGDIETAYKAADEALDGRLDVLEAKFTGEGSVAEQIAAAKQEAINTAAGDATSKANAAEAAAKTYADGLNTAMDTRVQAVEAAKHTHSNKDLLDTYTQTEANLADAVAKKHDHTNKTVLDGITAEKVTAWDAAEGNAKAYAKTYADGLAGNYATAAQGAKADTALQAADIATGATNGTIAVKGTDVAVMGLKSAAYTESSAYATAAQGALAASAVQEVVTGVTNGTIKVDGVEVAVAGLKSAAFTEASDYATAAQGTKADEAHAALTWGTL